jgi:glyoxylase-like metal-dependent hydrolase (beta-lactamase superfamily II)
MKIASLILLSLFASSAFAWQLPGVGDFKFEALTKDVYVMHGPNTEPNVANQGFMNNPAVIVSQNGVILIDPGSTLGVGENVLAELIKITDKPVLAIFNTHIHGDHWLANHAIANAYPQAKIYAHVDMKAQAADQGLVWLDLMAQLTEGLSSNTRLVIPGHVLTDGAEIEIDGQRLRIHANIPAHTNTDIMIEHLNSKTVFLGDNCFRDRFGQFDTSSGIGGNIEALERTSALDIQQFVPGHGNSGSRTEVVEPYLNYLRLLNEVTAAGFEEELQGYEIKQANLARFESWQDWQGFETYLGKHIDKMYLEVEEKAW